MDYRPDGRRAWRGDRVRRREFITLLGGLAILIILSAVAAHGQPQTSDDWFAMVVAIQREIDQADLEQRQIRNLNAEHRRFVQKMINELSASADAKPTVAQGRWLLTIKEWVKAK